MKYKLSFLCRHLSQENGVTAVIVAICILVLISFGALAIDVGHLYVVRNELKNAADAGALAGGRVLYTDNSGVIAINTDANSEARDVALANKSEKLPVEVNWTSGNTGDVQRGHWRFSDRTFHANDSTVVVSLEGKTAEELDADLNFINAIMVRTRRQANPATAFLARIFGFESFGLVAESVAYLGFPGNINPGEADQPIAICKQSITDGDGFRCSVGKMLTNNSDTAAWTNFTQPCETANPPSVTPNICRGNPTTLKIGAGMGTTNGVDNSIMPPIRDCWNSETGKVAPWKVTLPVIDCPGSIGPCETLVGAVEVYVLWIRSNGNDPNYTEVPTQMSDPWNGGTWTCTGTNATERMACWDSFVQRFGLEKSPGQLATVANDGYLQNTLYFKPSCNVYLPPSTTGGAPFNTISDIPVLVK